MMVTMSGHHDMTHDDLTGDDLLSIFVICSANLRRMDFLGLAALCDAFFAICESLIKNRADLNHKTMRRVDET